MSPATRAVYETWVELVTLQWLRGDDGRLSFSKMVTASIMVASIMTGTFGLGIAVAALSASFGVKVFLAFIARHTSSSNEQVTINAAEVIKEIRARRDEENGTEATP
jgi:hypothetical protein